MSEWILIHVASCIYTNFPFLFPHCFNQFHNVLHTHSCLHSPSLDIMLALAMRDQDKDNRLQKYGNERRESSWKRTKRILNVHYISIKNTLVGCYCCAFPETLFKIGKGNSHKFVHFSTTRSTTKWIFLLESSDHQLNEMSVLMFLLCNI